MELKLFGVGLLLEGEVATGDLKHVELPEILMKVIGVGDCLLCYRKKVKADVSAKRFYVNLEVFEVVREEIKVVEKGREEDESIVREAKEVVVVGDDGILLCFWYFYNLVYFI